MRLRNNKKYKTCGHPSIEHMTKQNISIPNEIHEWKRTDFKTYNKIHTSQNRIQSRYTQNGTRIPSQSIKRIYIFFIFFKICKQYKSAISNKKRLKDRLNVNILKCGPARATARSRVRCLHRKNLRSNEIRFSSITRPRYRRRSPTTIGTRSQKCSLFASRDCRSTWVVCRYVLVRVKHGV